MNNSTFKKQLDMREKIWGSIAALTMLSVFVGVAYYLVYISQQSHELSSSSLSFAGNIVYIATIAAITIMTTGAVSALILKPIDFWLRRWYLKEYFIEDCGDVVKLHGSIRLDGLALARKDLLSSRPDYKVIDDASKQYGCTMAAIRK